MHEPPPRFSHWKVTGVPSMIEQLVLSCLSKSPADRPESARVLMETYELALGQRLLEDDSFTSSAEMAVSTLQERDAIDPSSVVDRFEACMPEQMAAMKLRGFVDGVGGQVAECDAGVIKVRLARITESEPKKSSWSWFSINLEEQIDWIPLDLHMVKKQAGTRSLVDITVVRPPSHDESNEQTNARQQFCETICRELRAYLMAGR